MKFKKFATLTKKVKHCAIVLSDNLQYLSNGYTFYPMHNLPEIDDATLLALLDVENPEELNISRLAGDDCIVDFNDTDPDEEPLTAARFDLHFDNSDLIMRPVYSKYGLYYYCDNWIAPFVGENYTLYIRYNERLKTPYITVKTGLIILGYVLLADLNKWLAERHESKEDMRTLVSMLTEDNFEWSEAD